MSLPEFGGMDTGFNSLSTGADPGEYDLVLSNSEGGLESLLCSRSAPGGSGCSPGHPIPGVLLPAAGGEGDRCLLLRLRRRGSRRDWMKAASESSSRALPELDFALGGQDFLGDTGSARLLGDIPFPAFPRAISAARVNLCLTRRSHASVYASSSCRPFELAAAGAAIVTNPYEGIERWFEPGSELIVANDSDEAVAAYRALLDDPAQAEEMGRRARERVLDEHTYRHRARRVLDLLDLDVKAHVG